MSKFVGFIVGTALVVAGIATGNPYLVIQGGLMIVSNAVMLLTMPKTPARQASEMSIQLGEQPRVLLVGETFTAGSLVDGANWGGKYGTDWEGLLIRLADHKCHSLTGFYVNDEYVPYTGNGNYPQFDGDHFELYFRSDTSTQPLPDHVLNHFPGWEATDIGESGCDVLVCYKADKPDAKKPAWPGGRPRFGFVVKGALCYDPRLDDTVTGGSGAHRFDDPATWEWSENAAICRYKWVRGVYANDDVTDQSKLLVGRGLTAEEAPPENIIAPANLCDEIAGASNPYDSRDGLNSLTNSGISPDGSTLITTDSLGGGSHVQAWDMATRSLIAESDLPDDVNGHDIGVVDNRTFYAIIHSFPPPGELWLLDVFGGGSLVTADFDAASIGGCQYAGSTVCILPAGTSSLNFAYFDGARCPDIVAGFNATGFFADSDGDAWAVGPVRSGGNIGLCHIPTQTITILNTGFDSDCVGMDNGAGQFYVHQASARAILIDKATMTIVHTSADATGATNSYDLRRAMAVFHPGDASVWIDYSEWSTQTGELLRTVDPGDWVGAGSTNEMYDRVNHAILSQDANTLYWRFLDRHGGYRVAGPIYANQEFIDVEQMFAAATAGNIITHEGSVELEPGQAKSVVASFTDKDLLVGSKAVWNQGFLSQANQEWINTAVARYVEPDQKWNDHAAPVVRDTADILADGKPREASITLRLVRYQEQALRVAEIARRMGRIWGRASVKLGPRFCELEDGDWINWQSDRRFAGGTKTFRVEAYQIDEKWQIALTLREISGSIFADDAVFDRDLSRPSTSPLPPPIGAPDASNWTLTATTLASDGASVPALVVEGSASDDDYAESIIVEYWLDDGVGDPATDPDSVAWTLDGTYPPSTTRVEITGLTGGATYYVAITYVVDGEPGDRLVLGPATLVDYVPDPSLITTADTTVFRADQTAYRADRG